jgi:hypothetical protein
MSIFIFSKNSNNVLGSLYKIASSQSVYDANKNWQDDLYDIVTVNDNDYTAVKLEIKYVVSKNGNEVTYENCEVRFTSENQLTSYINNIKTIFEGWLIYNSAKPFASSAITYLNYIKSINVSSLSITEENPLNSSLEAYVESQGIAAVHPLELL